MNKKGLGEENKHKDTIKGNKIVDIHEGEDTGEGAFALTATGERIPLADYIKKVYGIDTSDPDTAADESRQYADAISERFMKEENLKRQHKMTVRDQAKKTLDFDTDEPYYKDNMPEGTGDTRTRKRTDRNKSEDRKGRAPRGTHVRGTKPNRSSGSSQDKRP